VSLARPEALPTAYANQTGPELEFPKNMESLNVINSFSDATVHTEPHGLRACENPERCMLV
jgi:hypothetical protein